MLSITQILQTKAAEKARYDEETMGVRMENTHDAIETLKRAIAFQDYNPDEADIRLIQSYTPESDSVIVAITPKGYRAAQTPILITLVRSAMNRWDICQPGTHAGVDNLCDKLCDIDRWQKMTPGTERKDG